MIGLTQGRKAIRMGKTALLAGLTLAAVAGTNRAANAQDLIYGFTSLNRFFSVSTSNLGTINNLGSITGVAGSLLDIDFRPANGVLYGLGNNLGTLSLYTINLSTGAATSLATYTNVTAGADDYDIDFNPAADALRIIGSNGDNYRVPSATNTFATLAVDGSVNGATVNNILGTAYTNNVAGATGTTQYYIGNNGQLYTTAAPNTGTVTTVGAANNTLSAATIGFDVSSTGNAYIISNNVLYLENLTNGTATSLGTVATPGGTIRGISATIAPAAAPEPGSLVLLGTGLVSMGGIAVRRKAKKA